MPALSSSSISPAFDQLSGRSELVAGEVPGLLERLAQVPDPRSRRGVRHPLVTLLGLTACAVLAGATSFAAIIDWLYDLDEQDQVRLGFTRGVPAGTTMWRLLTRLDAALLSSVLAGSGRGHRRHPPGHAATGQ